VSPLPIQDEYETLETFFENVDLSFAEGFVRECFHIYGLGRPPRSPLGLFQSFIVMRMKGIRSLREMARLLNVDPRTRTLCLIKERERGYPRSVLSRFTRRVRAERLRRIIEEKVVNLLERKGVEEVDVVLDASFIKAWSIRHPIHSRRGYADADTRVGRAGRTYELGYKLHRSINRDRILPLACVVAPANDNEKKHDLTLLERTRGVLRKAGAKLRNIIADSQYSSERIRQEADEAIIPYPANKRRGVKGILRVDKRFRTYGPEDPKRKYRKRTAVEAAYSLLKTRYSLTINKVRGLKNVATYILYSMLSHVMTREATENMGRPDKAVSPTDFNT
jgi:transposase